MGLRVFFKALSAGVGKRSTTKYPRQKTACPEYRGHPVVDAELCISCGMCQRVCPAFACVLAPLSEKDSKKVPRFDYKKCCLCGQCAFFCPTKAIRLTDEYEFVLSAGEYAKK